MESITLHLKLFHSPHLHLVHCFGLIVGNDLLLASWHFGWWELRCSKDLPQLLQTAIARIVRYDSAYSQAGHMVYGHSMRAYGESPQPNTPVHDHMTVVYV